MPTRWRSRPGTGRRPDSPPRAGAGGAHRAAARRESRQSHRQTGFHPGPETGTGSRGTEALRRARRRLWTGLQTQGWDRPRLGVGASSLLLGAALRASPSTCEAPAASTRRPPACWAGWALAILIGAGRHLTPAFRAFQKWGYGLGSVAHRRNCFARWGHLAMRGWGIGS